MWFLIHRGDHNGIVVFIIALQFLRFCESVIEDSLALELPCL